MAHLLRLIAVTLVLFSGLASAAVPERWEYRMFTSVCQGGPRTSDWAPFPAGVSNYAAIASCKTSDSNTRSVSLASCNAVALECTFTLTDTSSSGSSTTRTVTYGPDESRIACPANSTKSGATCTCNAGFLEKDGQCIPKKSDVCGPLQGMGTGITSMDSDFGTQSAAWAGSKVGKSANSCLAGCQVSGSVSSCVVGTGKSSSTVCYLSGTSFTGDSCTNSTDGGGGGTEDPSGEDKDKPKDCPVGYEPSKYVPGLCIPKPNDCPSGSSPSKYAEGVCIPDEKGDDGSCEDPKDPTKRAECEGGKNQCPSGQVQSTTQVGTCVPGKDGVDKDKNGSKVECKDGKCTVTKADGSKEDKGQDEVCKEQPDLAMCKESKGQFSGSCSANFRCDGDVLQCAALQEQHKRNCTMFDIENDMSRFFDADAKKPQENVLTANGTEIDLKGHITVDSIIGNGQCPADVPLQVFGKTVVFKLSEFCRYFNAMGMLLFLSTCATCLRILGT